MDGMGHRCLVDTTDNLLMQGVGGSLVVYAEKGQVMPVLAEEKHQEHHGGGSSYFPCAENDTPVLPRTCGKS